MNTRLGYSEGWLHGERKEELHDMACNYRICTRCAMDSSDWEISFDENGVCNHCRTWHDLVSTHVFVGEDGEHRLATIVNRIRKQGRNHQYDCVIGLSGGVDSTYVAYLTTRLGLRPLAITMDNGWDSEAASSNVRNAARRLNLDLHTCRIDWDEFRDLQLAYLRAGVLNLEAPTDHAIRATLFNAASSRGIKYILVGYNIATEGILPRSWKYNTDDLVNLRAIHRRHGKSRLRSYPTMGLRRFLYYEYFKRIETIPILNYVRYVKGDAKRLIAQELDWKDYGAKHHESIFTRFYQTYILPRRFGIDKRRAHLSALICSGEISREDALREIQGPPCAEEVLKQDKEYLCAKLGVTDAEFEGFMNLPVSSHLDYATDLTWRRLTLGAAARLRRLVGW